MAAPAKSSPRDAQVMAAILKDMGVTDYEPRVINQMLEFVYRYVTDVLEDAKVYSSHCSKKAIDVEDVKLAVQCRMDQSFTSPPPKDLLMEISKHKNSQVLPLIKPYCGLRLPPDRYCLSAPNYKVACQKVMKKHQPRIQIGLPMNQFHQRININQMTHGIPTGKVGHPGSGNTTLAVVTKNMTIPTVTIVTKPSQPQGAPLIKPSIKLSTGPALNSLNQNKSFATTPHIQTQPSIQNLSQTSLHSQQQLSILNQHQSSIHIQPLSSSTSSLITSQANPLKRKLEDDDYDNPS